MQYIGARYVPIFYENSQDGSTLWEMNVKYEPLTYVTDTNNHLYISKKTVPDYITNPALNLDYWLDVTTFNGDVQQLQDEIDALTLRADNLEALENGGVYAVKLTELGVLDLPAGHTVQGMEIYNNYLYVFHHINDNSENTVSKYNATTLTHIADVSLPDGMHGNGMTINRTDGYIIITNSLHPSSTLAYKGTLIFIPLATFNTYSAVDYTGGGSTSISALAVSPDGKHFAESVTSCGMNLVGNVSRSVASPSYNSPHDNLGSCVKQDMSGSDRVYYQLATGHFLNADVQRNFVDVHSYTGAKIMRIMLDNTLPELEGISCTDDENLFIVDVNGKVYTTNISTLLDFAYMENIGTGRNNHIANFVSDNHVVHNPNNVVAGNGTTEPMITTRIACPNALVSAQQFNNINGTCVCNNYKGFAAVTASHGLRLCAPTPNGYFQANYNYDAVNEEWVIAALFATIPSDSVARSVTVDPSTALAGAVSLGFVIGKTNLFQFGNLNNMRGYPIVGLKLKP